MRAVYRLLRHAGATDVTVLLTGESGTGKELAARALHDESTRRRGPFIAVNCSASPGELIESELFGHVRGAFTGADRDRIGVFEAASGGTLFLDEIGELSEAAQAKLLRALEEQRVTRVGATTATNVDVRIVAATNRNLELMVRERTFREDLLYRVAVVQIALPPLRERREDIMALTAHFIAHFAQRHSVAPRAISELARRALLACDWPGNVRELRNTIERALVLAEGDEIDVADLPASVSGSTTALRPAEAVLAELPFADARQRALEAFDRSFLSAALERHGGNISATARALGLHRQSLQKLLRRLGISDLT
jgi:DNA-binding NtrC family response regulator